MPSTDQHWYPYPLVPISGRNRDWCSGDPPGNARHYPHRSGRGDGGPHSTPGGGDGGPPDDP